MAIANSYYIAGVPMPNEADLGKFFDAKEMAETLSRMISIKAISPASGGAGEMERANFLKSILKNWGFDVNEYDYVDAYNVKRPNLVVKYGNNPRTLWIVPHMDTVSEGSIEAWHTDPFNGVIKDGRVYGRGSIDDGQSLVGAMYALKAVKDSGIGMKYNFGLAIVADEELGSAYGIERLINEKALFSESDMFLVPDWGTSSGDKVEVAEKSVLWLKFTFEGKQVHASTPNEGANALRAAIKFFCKLDEFLHDKYNIRNPIFEPQESTFEMTKHEKNVDSINIVPGREVFYMDSRILPDYDINEVIESIEKFTKTKEFGNVAISMSIEDKSEAPTATPANAEIVSILQKTVKRYRGIEPKPVGIGGATCATFFRRKGFPTAVWMTGDDVAHQPNEYASIDNLVNDAKVFAGLFEKS